jgi:hypothetical protein
MQLFIWRLCKATEEEAAHMHHFVSQVASERQMATIDLLADTNVTVLAMEHLCTLLSLAPTRDTTMQVYKPDSRATAQSYDWLTSNWKEVQSLSSRHAKMPDTPPSRGNIGDWEQCMKRVFKEQLGVGIKKQRDRKTNKSTHLSSYVLTAGSIWKTLGVDLPSYIQWLCGGEAEMTVVSTTVYVPCDLCDIDGGPVECVFQGGVARCVLKSSLHVDEHRDLKMPLDVGLATEFDQLVIKRNTEMISVRSVNLVIPPVFSLLGEEEEEEKVKETSTKMDPDVVDRLLKFLGFVDGVNTSEPVPLEDVLSAVANNELLSLADQAYIRETLAWSLSTVNKWTNATQVTPVLRKLATNAGFNLTNERVQRQFTRGQVYSIATTSVIIRLDN